MLRIEGLTKRFGETLAVSDLSLELREGEFLSLLGPSGCGKTTTLRMIAGFETPDSGTIRLQGSEITRLSPQKRRTGMVFQSYALFPHLDVFENVAYGLRAQGAAADGIRARVLRALERVDLAGYERRSVQALSGGQQQRVALARAMAPEPPLLLLDEPLSNLDAALRERTRVELRSLLKEFGITSVFVTHDQEEAFALSDRIAVLDRGLLQQVGSPEELYDQPVNAFVAGFVGRANFLAARLVEASNGNGVCELPDGTRWPVRLHAETTAGAVRLMVRPEALRITESPDEPGAPPGPSGSVLDRRFGGATTHCRVQVEGLGEVLVSGERTSVEPGRRVRIVPAPGATLHAFPPSSR